MYRRNTLHLAAIVRRKKLGIDDTKLFGSGRARSADQLRVYKQLKGTTIEAAFPHIAACWVGPCWGTVMQTPNNVSPVCTKMAVWRCSQCMEEFEMSIAKFIDDGGVCPECNKPQKKLSDVRVVKKSTTEGGKDIITHKAPQYDKAPRMVHSNYKSVLYHNPEWDSKNIQPMLAQRWEQVADQLLAKSLGVNKDGTPNNAAKEELLLASPKIDGVRCMVGFNPKKKQVQFFSRGGIVLECCESLVPALLPLFKDDPSLMLDGELFAPECNFEQLNGLVRRLSKTSNDKVREAQSRLLEYFAFDIMYSRHLSAPDAPFDERYTLLKKVIPVCGAKRISNYIHDEKKKKVIRKTARDNNGSNSTALGAAGALDIGGAGDGAGKNKLYHVPAAIVRPEEMDDVLKEACSQGFEGVMIRRPEFPYEHGRRSFGLLKYKQMHDAEFKIVGFLPGEGKFKGYLGAFVCETKDGLKFHAPPKVTKKRRLELWTLRKEYLGKFLTVQYQELSFQDVPRFPIAKAVRGGANKSNWL